MENIYTLYIDPDHHPNDLQACIREHDILLLTISHIRLVPCDELNQFDLDVCLEQLIDAFFGNFIILAVLANRQQALLDGFLVC